ncbi:hypothetical protein GCM10027277_26890 [Pseudoduganella ginsengisoli]|uniref:GNAT family N-acetyltransferase n=1 Tax=Pseudoduganella ginsengisoli TaxID=1462440 RepID=A0A6L6Q264_9BURK|nr:GNAT family N-acetyltransferase [Pseudoduganella ginsengisoli]MTW03504.1 GNAT family N-acetyltransferase [Pseudoduganella ginsengisoli]
MIKVERVPVVELGQVAGLYQAAGYGGGVAEADVTLAAWHGGHMIGVVRLCEEGGVTVLRGMQVLPEFQRQGVGRMLLEHCVPYLDRDVAYCLPYTHLVQFYGQAGFATAAPEELPPFLAKRLVGYAVSGHKVLAMRRSGSGAGGIAPR